VGVAERRGCRAALELCETIHKAPAFEVTPEVVVPVLFQLGASPQFPHRLLRSLSRDKGGVEGVPLFLLDKFSTLCYTVLHNVPVAQEGIEKRRGRSARRPA